MAILKFFEMEECGCVVPFLQNKVVPNFSNIVNANSSNLIFLKENDFQKH